MRICYYNGSMISQNELELDDELCKFSKNDLS